MIARGGETDTLSEERAQEMIDSLSQCKLVNIPRAGHMVFEDNPTDFISQVSAFLK